MKPTLAGFALLVLGLGLAGPSWAVGPPASESAPATTARWEYRVLTKEEIRDLGGKEFVAGLNKLGADGWELAGIDGIYIFKRSREQLGRRAEDLKSLIPLLESDLELQKDRVAWAERMVKKGFLSERQAEAERLKMKSAEINLQRARRELLPVPPRRLEPAEKEPKPEK